MLPGYTDKGLALTGKTERILALHVADGGLGVEDNVMVIGWDRARVNNKAHDIDMQQSSGRGVLRLSHDWARQMMNHHEFAQKLHNRAENHGRKATSSFNPHDITGNYVVDCEDIQHDWPVLSKQLRLGIINSQTTGYLRPWHSFWLDGAWQNAGRFHEASAQRKLGR